MSARKIPSNLPRSASRAKSCQYSIVLYAVERSRGCVHIPCWMWPTQFMSKALSRISFVIARLSGLVESSFFCQCSGMDTGRYSEVTVPARLTRAAVFFAAAAQDHVDRRKILRAIALRRPEPPHETG